LLLGLLASARLPNLALAASPVAWHLLQRQWRRAAAIGLAAAVGLGLAAGASRMLTGAADPYQATRASFNSDSGYPAGEEKGRVVAQFQENPATHHPSLAPRFDLRESLYSGLYFLVGRHTGLFFYFPASLALLLSIAARPGRRAIVLLAAVAAMGFFYLVWMPDNYFGGSTFVGNRYFLAAYPALLAALSSLPGRRLLLFTWTLAVVAAVSGLLSAHRAETGADASQSHTRAGLFRLLPFESTAAEIDGVRSRSWLGDRVRFLDPFAKVEDRWFSLSSALRPAEVEIATSRSGNSFRLLVDSDRPDAELVVEDWARVSRYPLATSSGPERRILEILTSPAWRRHSVAEAGAGAAVRTLRLSIESRDGTVAAARLQYLGDPEFVHRDAFDRQVLRARLPRTAIAGTVDRIPVRVRNLSSRGWATTPLIPVHLSYRLLPEGEGPLLEGVRTRLPRPVRPGQILVAQARIVWPERPGRYFLRLDLVQENVAWFEDKVGRPLARRWVEVLPAESADRLR
jgi:hypothetical protein